MDNMNKALPPEGSAKPTQNARKIDEITRRDRFLLAGALVWCLLAVDTVLWAWPHGMGVTAALFGWTLLLAAALGRRLFEPRESRVLLVALLLLGVSFALTSSAYFRFWNFLALLALAPLHACGLSQEVRRPWWDLSMVPERLRLLFRGLFGQLGAAFAALVPAGRKRDPQRVLSAVLGTAAALALLGILVPVLSSADALFAAATEGLRAFIAQHLTESLWKLVVALVLTPFLFGLLYRLRRPAAYLWGLSLAAFTVGVLLVCYQNRTSNFLTYPMILGILSSLYFFISGSKDGTYSDALSALGFIPVVWCVTAAWETYTDQFTAMNSPIKVGLQMGFLGLALILVSELRYRLGKPLPRVAAAFMSMGVFTSLNGAIPVLLGTGAHILDNQLHLFYAIVLLCGGLYGAYTLFQFLWFPAEAEAADVTPEATEIPTDTPNAQ